jgi:hypothetical protein
MSPQKPKITIDLAHSDNDHIRSDVEHNLIHITAFHAIEAKIKNQLDRVQNNSKANTTVGSGGAFFIDGTRGAGKSTFLNTLVHELTQDTRPYKLKLLLQIDPTKVEIGEHIFITLLQKLKEHVKDLPRHFSSTDQAESLEEWRKLLRQLAGGLKLLDEKNNPLMEVDEEAFLDWGLQRAKSGLHFAQDFQKLIIKSCALFQIDAFLIAIDDADTDFTSGRQILEMIRRYLDIPQIITLMTGDLQLYTHLVRDKFLENMGENLFKYDTHRAEERLLLLDHLEDQYLKKLFPINRRVHLTPLWELREDVDYQVQFTHGALSLDDLIYKLLSDGLRIKSPRDKDSYREFLLKQPLRSLIQLLQFCTENLKSNNDLISTGDLTKGIRSVLLGSLYAQGIDVDALSSEDIAAVIDGVFRVVANDGEFDTGSYLRPQPANETLRNCFVALAAEVARHSDGNPATAIKYMLQGPGSLTIYNNVSGLLGYGTGAQTEAQKQRLFMNYFSIGRHEDALNWSWRACDPLIGTPKARFIRAGVIRLKYSIHKQSHDECPVFALSLVNVIYNHRKTYASIFNTLGVVVRLLELLDLNEDIKELSTDAFATKHSQLKDKVSSELTRLTTTLSISAPPWTRNESSYNEEDSPESDPTSPTTEQFDTLVKAVTEWLFFAKEQSSEIKPSAVMLGKIWTRLYFSLVTAGDQLRIKSKPELGTASIMEIYALCLINAFLVEEADHHALDTDGGINGLKINRRNPTLSSTVVMNKFKEGFSADSLPFTRIIGTCPLVLDLIQEEDAQKIFHALNKGNKFGEYKPGCINSIFDALNLHAQIAGAPAAPRATSRNRTSNP